MTLSQIAFLEAAAGAIISALAAGLLFRAWWGARSVRTLLLVSAAMASAAVTAAAFAFVSGLEVLGIPLTPDERGTLRLLTLALLGSPGLFGLWLYWTMRK